MPIYEYKCCKCSQIYEIWQKISDTPPDKCTECGGPLHKLVSLSSFQLKGGGWYVDGYSDAPKKAKNEKEGDAPEKSSPKSPNINNKGKTDTVQVT
jgi:putative FmdB family regulatory protein